MKLTHICTPEVADPFMGIEGDVAEIGVAAGESSRVLIALAKKHDKRFFAFDSFIGMNTPGPMDGGHNPKGKFNVGGVKKWLQIVPEANDPCVEIYPGYIPECFCNADVGELCFVYLDVDHYAPTAMALGWVWPLISKGGGLFLDDYFNSETCEALKLDDDFKNLLATGAIIEFLKGAKFQDMKLVTPTQLLIIK